MAHTPLRNELLQQCVDAVAANGGVVTRAAETLRITRETLSSRLRVAKLRGIKPGGDAGPSADDEREALLEQIRALEAEVRGVARTAPPSDVDLSKQESLRAMLRRGACSVETICQRLSVLPARARAMLEALRAQGFLIAETSEGFAIHATPPPAAPTSAHQYLSRPGGYFKFGYTSDNHLCSKYAREDVLADLYDWFAAEGVDRVMNTGNYIDGEFHFNKHDIHVHGMQNQLDYFCQHYPARTVGGKPLVTYLVSGDDHEGWYGQREGVDIGWLMERTAQDKFKRNDLVNLGYMEAFVRLVNADDRSVSSQMLVTHPGGGSAYATSYAPQKYVEALQGGEKPAVILFGHWHKIFDLLIRNVICLGGGCTKDLDTFGRKKRLAYHIGGMIVELWQDQSGSITRWRVEKKQYFDRGYYNDQWSYVGAPSKTPA